MESAVWEVTERAFSGCGFVDCVDFVVLIGETDYEDVVRAAGVESDTVDWPVVEAVFDFLPTQASH